MERSSSKKRARRSFTAEFKADAVRLCRAGDRGIRQVARDLGLTETSLRTWVRRAEAAPEPATGAVEALTRTEREELTKLRRELRRVTMERDILKKATEFFASLKR